MQLTIVELFGELLNLHGDRGNITVLEKRCRLRGIDTEVISCSLHDEINLKNADIVYLGSGSDQVLEQVCKRLTEFKSEFLSYRDDGGVLLAVANSYPLLGTEFCVQNRTCPGLSLLDIHTEQHSEKLIGNICVNTPFGVLVGFENHSGRTCLGTLASPLGKVLNGHGNNGTDHTEGALYKNIYGTYLHGPLLPKNPELADLLIAKALERKYGTFPELTPLSNKLENLAKGYLLNYGNRTHKR